MDTFLPTEAFRRGYADALAYATFWHGEQVRKYTMLPYISHPIAVAKTVSWVPRATVPMIQAALLHDVFEDTPARWEDVLRQFGETTLEYVRLLSDHYYGSSNPANRKTRKRETRNRMAIAPAVVKTIKLADIIDNTQGIATYDPDFAPVYIKELSDLLDALDGGDDLLWRRADNLLRIEAKTLEENKLQKALEKI